MKQFLAVSVVCLMVAATGCAASSDGGDPSGSALLSASGVLSQNNREEAWLPVDLESFHVVGYDDEPGDFAHQFELSETERAEFLALLQTDQWELAEDLPERGFTGILRAVNEEGSALSVGVWDENHSIIGILPATDSPERIFYLAPAGVAEKAAEWKEKLEQREG